MILTGNGLTRQLWSFRRWCSTSHILHHRVKTAPPPTYMYSGFCEGLSMRDDAAVGMAGTGRQLHVNERSRSTANDSTVPLIIDIFQSAADYLFHLVTWMHTIIGFFWSQAGDGRQLLVNERGQSTTNDLTVPLIIRQLSGYCWTPVLPCYLNTRNTGFFGVIGTSADILRSLFVYYCQYGPFSV